MQNKVIKCNSGQVSEFPSCTKGKVMTNGEFKIELEKRTVDFSVSVLRLLRRIPLGIESRNIKDQLARSATAVSSNYREANRAESRNDFVHKIAVVAKEASESEYWLLLLKELHPDVSEIAPILVEAGELVRIFDKIRLTMRNQSK